MKEASSSISEVAEVIGEIVSSAKSTEVETHDGQTILNHTINKMNTLKDGAIAVTETVKALQEAQAQEDPHTFFLPQLSRPSLFTEVEFSSTFT